ncbi:hypothetical protein ACTXT7_010801 [Hymenolepis weldensis]
MSRCRSLGVMIDTRLGIYVQTRKHSGIACGHYSGDLIASQSFLIARSKDLPIANRQNALRDWEDEELDWIKVVWTTVRKEREKEEGGG